MSDVPAGVTMVGIPARQVKARDRSGAADEFVAYGTPAGDLPDPVAKVLDGMMREIQTLRTRVDELDGTTPKDDPETDDPCIGDSR